jgi:hypothetical protein
MPEFLRDCFQNLNSRTRHFSADAIAGQNQDLQVH